MEYFRLYYGYSGNIRERFPELTAFLIIMCVFSTPLLAYQYIFIAIILPLDYAVAIIQWIFMIIELFLAIGAIRRLVKNQTAIFFLRAAHPDIYYRVRLTQKSVISSREIEMGMMGRSSGIPSLSATPTRN